MTGSTMPEMDQYLIGWWGVRPGGKWHLIESEVTDRLVMRCGRQMKLVNATSTMLFQQEAKGERCEQCVGHRVAD